VGLKAQTGPHKTRPQQRPRLGISSGAIFFLKNVGGCTQARCRCCIEHACVLTKIPDIAKLPCKLPFLLLSIVLSFVCQHACTKLTRMAHTSCAMHFLEFRQAAGASQGASIVGVLNLVLRTRVGGSSTSGHIDLVCTSISPIHHVNHPELRGPAPIATKLFPSFYCSTGDSQNRYCTSTTHGYRADLFHLSAMEFMGNWRQRL
jgi:hypothetical protein